MSFDLDEPIIFKKSQCKTCKKNDADWCLMQFCDDGFWRTINSGTLREAGIDEECEPNMCSLHSCSVEIVKTFTRWKQVEDYFAKMK